MTVLAATWFLARDEDPLIKLAFFGAIVLIWGLAAVASKIKKSMTTSQPPWTPLPRQGRTRPNLSGPYAPRAGVQGTRPIPPPLPGGIFPHPPAATRSFSQQRQSGAPGVNRTPLDPSIARRLPNPPSRPGQMRQPTRLPGRPPPRVPVRSSVPFIVYDDTDQARMRTYATDAPSAPAPPGIGHSTAVEISSTAIGASTTAKAVAAVAGSRANFSRTSDDLVAQFILSELLDPPVALRDPAW